MDKDGNEVTGDVCDGSSGVALQILEEDGSVAETISRNAKGFFYRIYQPNKWKLTKEKAKQVAVAAGATA